MYTMSDLGCFGLNIITGNVAIFILHSYMSSFCVMSLGKRKLHFVMGAQVNEARDAKDTLGILFWGVMNKRFGVITSRDICYDLKYLLSNVEQFKPFNAPGLIIPLLVMECMKLVKFLLYLVSRLGWLELSIQPTPREVDSSGDGSWWWDCESKSGVESSAWVSDEGCIGDVERLGSICEVVLDRLARFSPHFCEVGRRLPGREPFIALYLPVRGPFCNTLLFHLPCQGRDNATKVFLTGRLSAVL
ncbi:hypothetical protein Tco_0175166 [Tanacetum coccineum]